MSPSVYIQKLYYNPKLYSNTQHHTCKWPTVARAHVTRCHPGIIFEDNSLWDVNVILQCPVTDAAGYKYIAPVHSYHDGNFVVCLAKWILLDQLDLKGKAIDVLKSILEIQWNLYIKTSLGTKKYGPYTQVVFICRFTKMESMLLGTCKMWFLYAGGL